MSGRPNEGRVKLTCYVLPVTAERIAYLVNKTKQDANTLGKVVDSQLGVRASKKSSRCWAERSLGPARAAKLAEGGAK